MAHTIAPYVEQCEQAAGWKGKFRSLRDAVPIVVVGLPQDAPADYRASLETSNVREVNGDVRVKRIVSTYTPGELLMPRWRDLNHAEQTLLENADLCGELGFRRIRFRTRAPLHWRVQVYAHYRDVTSAARVCIRYIPDQLVGELDATRAFKLPGEYQTLGALVEDAGEIGRTFLAEQLTPDEAIELRNRLASMAVTLASCEAVLKSQARAAFEDASGAPRYTAARLTHEAAASLVERMEGVIVQAVEYFKRGSDLCHHVSRVHAEVADLVMRMRIAHQVIRETPTIETARAILVPVTQQYDLRVRPRLLVNPYLSRFRWARKSRSAEKVTRLRRLPAYLADTVKSETAQLRLIQHTLAGAIRVLDQLSLGELPSEAELARRRGELDEAFQLL